MTSAKFLFKPSELILKNSNLVSTESITEFSSTLMCALVPGPETAAAEAAAAAAEAAAATTASATAEAAAAAAGASAAAPTAMSVLPASANGYYGYY